MKDVLFSVILIVVGVVGITYADDIRYFYEAAYPGDTGRSLALDRCAIASSAFNRLSAAQREACYAQRRGEPRTPQH